MTENEEVMILENLRPGCGEKLSFSEGEICEAIDTAISALEEIQQYREVDAQIKKIFDDQLGLVDIVKEYIEDIRRTHNGKTPRKVIALSVMEDK